MSSVSLQCQCNERGFCMNLIFVIQELTGFLKRKISYTDIAIALNVSRQYISQIKNKDLSLEQVRQIDQYFGTKLEKLKTDGCIIDIDDCVNIPVRGEVKASMGYGVTVYNEQQTASYSVSRKLIRDLGINSSQTEIIFAQERINIFLKLILTISKI